ncbi:MAG: hypothetical protein R2704_10170 [Microthrixaceae bacterium]
MVGPGRLCPRAAHVTVLVVDVGEGVPRWPTGLGRRGIDARAVAAEGLASAVAASDVVLVEATMAGPSEALCLTGRCRRPPWPSTSRCRCGWWPASATACLEPLYRAATGRWDASHDDGD